MKNSRLILVALALFCATPALPGALGFDDIMPGLRNGPGIEPSMLSGPPNLQRAVPRRLPEVGENRLETPVEPAAYETPGPISLDAAEMRAVGHADAVAFESRAEAAETEPYFTLEELRAEMRELAWTKGDFRIVPYGILWFNMAYETQRTANGDYTLFVLSPDDVGDGDAFHVNARSTRLGFDLTGPRIPWFHCASSGGKVEFDFWGQFEGGENKPGVLLRHAYWEVKDERFRLLGGQTWDVISPLYPGTLMYSVGWGGGNIGYRRAQLRAERYLALSDVMLVTLQGALAADLLSELSPAIAGNHAGWPVLEGRIGMTLGPRGKNCRPITFGVSGHVGEQEFMFGAGDADDVVAQTWSFNVDVRIPITERMGFQGEFFTGENLGAYLGGVVQGINPTTREPIRATGGWLELWYDWTPRVHSHLGYSIDDPLNEDVTAGRTYNQFIFANISRNLTDQFVVGLEYTSWQTLFDTKSRGESDRFALVAKYGF